MITSAETPMVGHLTADIRGEARAGTPESATEFDAAQGPGSLGRRYQPGPAAFPR